MRARGPRRSPAAVALVFGALLVAAPLSTAIVLGRPGDAPFLTGFGPASTHRGLPGRWTMGLGRVELPRSPLAARVTLQLQPDEARPGDAVEMFVDGARVAGVPLPAGRQTLAFTVPGCDLLRGCRASRITIRSAPWIDASTGETRGVFVGRVAINRGGFGGAPAMVWASALALALGVVAASFAATRVVPLAAGIAAWCAAALWIFRLPLSPWWPWLALASAALGSFCHLFGGENQTIGRSIGSDVGSCLPTTHRECGGICDLGGGAGRTAARRGLHARLGAGRAADAGGLLPVAGGDAGGVGAAPRAAARRRAHARVPFLTFVRERLLDGHLPALDRIAQRRPAVPRRLPGGGVVAADLDRPVRPAAPGDGRDRPPAAARRRHRLLHLRPRPRPVAWRRRRRRHRLPAQPVQRDLARAPARRRAALAAVAAARGHPRRGGPPLRSGGPRAGHRAGPARRPSAHRAVLRRAGCGLGSSPPRPRRIASCACGA